jgi:hypothetical protein
MQAHTRRYVKWLPRPLAHGPGGQPVGASRLGRISGPSTWFLAAASHVPTRVATTGGRTGIDLMGVVLEPLKELRMIGI